MGNKPSKPSTPLISRRTGIDRRWITSIGYHPERRSGKDRRLTQYRPFLTPIDSKDQGNQKNPYRDRQGRDVSTRPDESKDAFSEPPLSRTAETALVDRAVDD
jgi:hypothetical protein